MVVSMETVLVPWGFLAELWHWILPHIASLEVGQSRGEGHMYVGTGHLILPAPSPPVPAPAGSSPSEFMAMLGHDGRGSVGSERT